DAESGLPTGGLDFLSGQKNEGIVAHPASVSAAELKPRGQFQIIADPLNRVFKLAEFIGPKVVNLHPVPRGPGGFPLHHAQHRGNAILDVKVGLPLRAITQHLEMIGVFEQLAVKIKHVAMRVTLAEDRNETK